MIRNFVSGDGQFVIHAGGYTSTTELVNAIFGFHIDEGASGGEVLLAPRGNAVPRRRSRHAQPRFTG